MKRAVALTHAEFEGPSALAKLVADQGYALQVLSLHRGDDLPRDLAEGDLLIVMGGSMGVGDLDDARYPYLRAEVELLERRIAEDAPVIGVCLGAQLLAHAAGARVYPMRTDDGSRRVYEVGWAPIAFHASAGDDVLARIPKETPVLHWHGDTFDLPRGARLLASSAVCQNQGFRISRRIFGLQFHVETTREDIEGFLREDADFVCTANGRDGVERIRRDSARYLEPFRELGDRLLSNILRAACEASAL